jgi:hypothetical protein
VTSQIHQVLPGHEGEFHFVFSSIINVQMSAARGAGQRAEL